MAAVKRVQFKKVKAGSNYFRGYEVLLDGVKVGHCFLEAPKRWQAYEPFAQLPLKGRYLLRGDAALALIRLAAEKAARVS